MMQNTQMKQETQITQKYVTNAKHAIISNIKWIKKHAKIKWIDKTRKWRKTSKWPKTQNTANELINYAKSRLRDF